MKTNMETKKDSRQQHWAPDYFEEYLQGSQKVAVLEFQLRQLGITPATEKGKAKIIAII